MNDRFRSRDVGVRGGTGGAQLEHREGWGMSRWVFAALISVWFFGLLGAIAWGIIDGIRIDRARAKKDNLPGGRSRKATLLLK
jgi:hypothetical protein